MTLNPLLFSLLIKYTTAFVYSVLIQIMAQRPTKIPEWKRVWAAKKPSYWRVT
jgi:hypothetical protein